MSECIWVYNYLCYLWNWFWYQYLSNSIGKKSEDASGWRSKCKWVKFTCCECSVLNESPTPTATIRKTLNCALINESGMAIIKLLVYVGCLLLNIIHELPVTVPKLTDSLTSKYYPCFTYCKRTAPDTHIHQISLVGQYTNLPCTKGADTQLHDHITLVSWTITFSTISQEVELISVA